jgi:hypothetical protein
LCYFDSINFLALCCIQEALELQTGLVGGAVAAPGWLGNENDDMATISCEEWSGLSSHALVWACLLAVRQRRQHLSPKITRILDTKIYSSSLSTKMMLNSETKEGYTCCTDYLIFLTAIKETKIARDLAEKIAVAPTEQASLPTCPCISFPPYSNSC